MESETHAKREPLYRVRHAPSRFRGRRHENPTRRTATRTGLEIRERPTRPLAPPILQPASSALRMPFVAPSNPVRRNVHPRFRAIPEGCAKSTHSMPILTFSGTARVYSGAGRSNGRFLTVLTEPDIFFNALSRKHLRSIPPLTHFSFLLSQTRFSHSKQFAHGCARRVAFLP